MKGCSSVLLVTFSVWDSKLTLYFQEAYARLFFQIAFWFWSRGLSTLTELKLRFKNVKCLRI